MQRAPQPTTSRQQILLTHDQAEALDRLAASERVSKSEIVRRALARYQGGQEMEDEDAAAVLNQLSEALDQAISSVSEAVGELRAARDRRKEDIEAERRRVIAWIEDHPEEMDALARVLGSGSDDEPRAERPAWG